MVVVVVGVSGLKLWSFSVGPGPDLDKYQDPSLKIGNEEFKHLNNPPFSSNLWTVRVCECTLGCGTSVQMSSCVKYSQSPIVNHQMCTEKDINIINI